ncbi:MAG TPA: 3-deoxy-7-phosphoheptulonate synthase [Planctomycetota bacterium]|nr:3-deoxy-7-phosphoheptulonate synthase [Planctomycetota bacterium]
MIIVMSPGASQTEIDHILARVASLGLKTVLLQGTNRNVIACIGDGRPERSQRGIDRDALAAAPGVESVVPILAPYKIASREAKAEPTIIPIDGHTLGGKAIGVIAGPCTVESRQQIMETAQFVKEHGAVALRGGAFKPRTNPYSFHGLMEKGLEYLAEARERTGLSIVTEVMSPEQAPLVARYADVLQIGTRNMQNFALLSAVGETDKPVLLKRGMSASLEEFLLAAEYILAKGNQKVILCERGIRTFETHTRFTLSLSAVPALKEQTHLPVIVDPSHATGKSSLVLSMARAAIAAGADGLLVEVHPNPEEALLDGAQSINLPQFAEMMTQLKAISHAIGREM